MLYTLYNAIIGKNPETWQNGAPCCSQRKCEGAHQSDHCLPTSRHRAGRGAQIKSPACSTPAPPGTYPWRHGTCSANCIFQYNEYKIHVVWPT